jgi:enoyl-CoA hydratase/carnithine racemase
MAEPTLRRDDAVFVIDFGADENVTSDPWATRMDALLDEVDSTDGPTCLVTTGSGKHYSNGLDVGYMSSVDADAVAAYVGRVLAVVRRIMLLGVPTVAAVNGHAFGMGAFLSIAHDQVVMREDRGFFCFPEVHLGMSFPPPLMAIGAAVLTPGTLRRSMTTGHRYSGPEAQVAGIVDTTAPLEDLIDTAVAMARPLAPTAGPNLATIKRQLFPDVAAPLRSS